MPDLLSTSARCCHQVDPKGEFCLQSDLVTSWESINIMSLEPQVTTGIKATNLDRRTISQISDSMMEAQNSSDNAEFSTWKSGYSEGHFPFEISMIYSAQIIWTFPRTWNLNLVHTGFQPSQHSDLLARLKEKSTLVSWLPSYPFSGWWSGAEGWPTTAPCGNCHRCWWAANRHGCLCNQAKHPRKGSGGQSGSVGKIPGSHPHWSASWQSGETQHQTVREEKRVTHKIAGCQQQHCRESRLWLRDLSCLTPHGSQMTLGHHLYHLLTTQP